MIGQSKSPSGIGVFGYSDVTTGSAKGVEGRVKGPNALGVYGVNEASSGDGVGVYGINKANSGEGAGILGYNQNASSRWAGQFWAPQGNGVSISSAPGKVGLVIYQGSKNAAVDTNSGIRLLYSEESTEVWFSDYGFGQIVHGKATILIDPIFADTVNLDEGYHVFLQAYSDATIYVTKQNETVEAFVFSIGYAVCCRYSPGCNQPLGYSG